MSQDKIVITGSSGDVAPRFEINEFIKDKRQLSLYIQALTAMYSEEADPRVSWFSVSGIHGLPYVSWDQSPPPVTPDGQPGPYCTHATNIFPPWHRPYVALLEQTLHAHAVETAKKYSVDTNLWKSTAAKLRQPYWDWAINPVPPDLIIAQEKVKILVPPHGQEVEVDNPFYQYRFRGGETNSFSEPFKSWQYTLRYPTTDEVPHSDVQALKDALIQLSESDDPIKYRTYKMFLITDWAQFSTTAAAGPGDQSQHTNSLEGIHNTLHVFVGGPNGHMSVIDVAAFDPIFFLHHTQVDRLLSLWSYIHRVWVPEPDTNKDLTPFWNSQSTYWKSIGTTEATTFNYTYPELVGEPSPSDVAQIVTKLYGGGTFEPGPVTPAISALSAQPSQPSQPSQAANSIQEWTARIRTKQFELGGSFSVLIFLGNVPENSKDWLSSPTYVGSFDAFVNSSPELCANCQNQPDVEIIGFVHLNRAILNRQDDQASLHPDYVVPRLTKHLSWRILKWDGTTAELHKLPSLEVVVIATPLRLLPGAILPTADDPTHYHHITRGVPGGSRTIA